MKVTVMSRYFIQLSFKGTHYHGWQIQPDAISVQETLNTALTTLLRLSVNVTGAGRTDTGVHARYFIAHFDSTPIEDTGKLRYKLNQILPSDIAIQCIQEVLPGAHARFDAISRTYKYYLSKEKDPFHTDLVYKYPYNLDITIMNKACEILSSYEDFRSFSKLHTDVKNHICKLYYAGWQETSTQYVFEIKANRFLRNMVRAIVGTMLDLGRGKTTLTDFIKIIESKNRTCAGRSAPGKALFLEYIEYPKDIFIS